MKAANDRWNEKNKVRYYSAVAQNSRRLRSATPSWADKAAMRDFYERVKLCAALTGIDLTVDHIVPIKGDGVCGLHVPHNLQILKADDNRRKGARYDGHAG